MSQNLFDETEVGRGLDFIFNHYHVVEIRLLNATLINSRPTPVCTGYFNNAQSVMEALSQIQHVAGGVFFTTQQLNPQVIARCYNHFEPAGSGSSTGTNDVVRYEMLFIDFDPKRPSNTPSTDAQLQAAEALKDAVRIHFESLGWAEPAQFCSGNGYYLMYKVSLLPADTGLVKNVITTLATQFDTADVHIDKSVFDLPRIARLPGSLNCKGDNVPQLGFNQRYARLIDAPETMQEVSREQLMAVAGTIPSTATTTHSINATTGSISPEVRQYFEQEVLSKLSDVKTSKPYGSDGAELYAHTCIWDSSHTIGAFTILNPDGRITSKCKHDSCQNQNTETMLATIGSQYRPLALMAAADENGWATPRPIPIGNELPIFDPDYLPDSLRPFVQDVSERMRVPMDLVAVPVIIAQSTLIGRKLVVYPKQFDDMMIVPNLWGIVVARPGEKKSPSADEALAPIRLIESELLTAYEKDKKLHKSRVKSADAQIEALEKQMADPTTLPADIPLIEEQILDLEEQKKEPLYPKLIATDSTPEALQMSLGDNPNGIMIHVDEIIGLTKSFDKKGYETARSFYLTAWAGNQSYPISRVVRGNFSVNACLSIFGTTQPTVISGYIKKYLKGESGQDGFVERLQVMCAPEKIKADYEYVDRKPNEMARARYEKICRKIHAFKPANTDTFKFTERKLGWLGLPFDDKAQLHFIAYYSELEQRIEDDSAGSLPDIMKSHLSKYRSLIPSLALINHMAEHIETDPCKPISETEILRAIALSEYLELHTAKIYGVSQSVNLKIAHALLDKVKEGKLTSPFTANDVVHKGWSNLNEIAAVNAGIAVLEQYGWAKVVHSASGVKGGRPSTAIVLHPQATTLVDSVHTEVTAPSLALPWLDKLHRHLRGGESTPTADIRVIVENNDSPIAVPLESTVLPVMDSTPIGISVSPITEDDDEDDEEEIKFCMDDFFKYPQYLERVEEQAARKLKRASKQ